MPLSLHLAHYRPLSLVLALSLYFSLHLAPVLHILLETIELERKLFSSVLETDDDENYQLGDAIHGYNDIIMM